MITLALTLTGGVGALARVVLDGVLRRRRPAQFPWATMVINVSGSLLLGVLTGLVIYRGQSSDLKLVLGTGLCGGYTTFSTASFETVRLLQRRAWTAAAGNAVGTAVLTVAAGALGLAVTR